MAEQRSIINTRVIQRISGIFFTEGYLTNKGFFLTKEGSIIYSKLKLATVVEDDLKDPFSIATTLRCREGRYSFPWIAPLYP